MKQLDPKAFWLFFLQGIFKSVFIILIMFFWFFVSIITRLDNYTTNSVATQIIIIAILTIGIVAIYSKLTYLFYKYELTENGFRKEYGIIWKRYITIPYERIQNVDIYRGVLARLLGLSDLNIQTAGMSVSTGAYGKKAEGRLPALSIQEAEQIRDELISRARNSKSQGL